VTLICNQKLAFLSFIGGPLLFLPKTALFLFYQQVFSVNNNVRIASQIGIVFNFLCYFPMSSVVLYYNVPHGEGTWESVLATRQGEKGIPYALGMGSASVLLDIYIFVLPLPSLINLNMARAKRLQLVGLFATASL
jgi:hypothetical protein